VARSIPTKEHTNSKPDFINQIRYSGIEKEENEVLMVEFSHTITHPGTVMIHPQNAAFAYGAVMNPLLLDHITLKAVQSHGQGVNFLSV
jgi:hypothetical protein